MNTGLLRHAVATVLTVYGIETLGVGSISYGHHIVATVLTVYGIETITTIAFVTTIKGSIELQQCLPFTVLKRHLALKMHLSL